MERPPISFDSEGKLRVLDAEIYKQTEELEKEARSFVSSEFWTPKHSCYYATLCVVVSLGL